MVQSMSPFLSQVCIHINSVLDDKKKIYSTSKSVHCKQGLNFLSQTNKKKEYSILNFSRKLNDVIFL